MFDKNDVSVLVVDDEASIRSTFSKLLDAEGYKVDAAASATQALPMLKEGTYNVIVTDLRMPEMGGIDFLKRVKNDFPAVEVIIVTGCGTEDSAVEAVRAHASDYIRKPLRDSSVLIESVGRIAEKQFKRQQSEHKSRQELMELNQKLDHRNKELEESNKALKTMQSQLLQQEKMAAIGQLAAGVAHEINNPIAFVHSNLGTLRRHVEKITSYNEPCDELIQLCEKADKCPDLAERARELSSLKKTLKLDFVFDDLLQLVAESQEGTERVRKIVTDLKSFSRAEDEKKPINANVNECLERALGIVWNELKYKATVHKELGDIPLIGCYPLQLAQVFMNILVNAAQAIEEKGEIFIKTFIHGEHLTVEIRDTGAGISEKELKRIFEPFFTTKPAGKGTGLGLSIAYEIISKHRGMIEATSKVGEGTTFIIQLPATETEDD